MNRKKLNFEKEILKMPEMQAMKGVWQNEFHQFDVYNHTLNFVKHLKKMTPDKDIIAAGYFHDVAKPITAKVKMVDGKIQYHSTNNPYHSFDNHEVVGERVVSRMPKEFFNKYGLNQEKIAKLVGAHYLPMDGIKEMRKAKSYSRFILKFNKLQKKLDKTKLSRKDIMLMFLADKLAQGRSCSDKRELFSIRGALLKKGANLMRIYRMQRNS